MPLNSGLFQEQDQNERDLTGGAGWTIDEQKPTVFENLTGAIPRGIGQGLADGLSVLTHGVRFPEHLSPMESVMSGPLAASQAISGKSPELEPWKQSWNEGAQELETSARQYSKSLIPDPRVTGTGANLVQGFAHAVSEYTAGAVAGGPVGGAALLGTSEGYAHYLDLLDQGVDDATARKSALLTGVVNAAGAVLPMSLPAKTLGGLSTAGTLLAQAGAGAAINTGFGVASRYASAKILRDAGYPEMADQQEPWDGMNVAVDALSGLFFGAHAGWHGLKAGDVDPSVRDAAKVVQDRQATADRAPGVPVDMASAAIHRESLETALGDLLSDRPVSLRGEDVEGASFARPEENTEEARSIMHDEFVKSGVLDTAAQFDRWLAGEPEPKRPEVTPGMAAGEAPDVHPDADLTTQVARDFQNDGTVVSEQTPSHPPTAALADRPALQIVGEDGEPRDAASAHASASAAESQANKDAEPMFRAAVDCEARHA